MIEVNNLTTAAADEGFLKKVAKIVLKGENKIGFGLSIALVGQERIKELNKKYRKKNQATDVLAFPYGEVVLCPEKTRDLSRILIHGILHLLGYDHEKTKKEAKRMAEKENYYLSLIK
ncbi:MAG: rRNA maturation RNase YbeY [bacterium]